MTVKNLYPNIEPSLSLDFANTKALDPRITFARASTARFYDGKTVAKAEENLIAGSQAFTTTADSWPSSGQVGVLSLTNNSSTAPDGTSTAATVVEDTSTGIHVISRASAVSGVVTLSVFAKLGAGTRFLTIGLNNSLANHGSATFDLSTGTNTQTQANGTYSGASATITAVAQGFYRCSFTVTTDTATVLRIGLNDTGTPTTGGRAFGVGYTGDGTSSLIIWGAQLEQRSAVTAYTPTTTQPITNYVPVLQSAANNVARFDHNPVTGESLGLLMEEQRTNLVTRSEEFDDAAWTKTDSSITANTIVAPDGALTGDKFISASGATGLLEQTQTGSGLTTYTFSIYLKKGEDTSTFLVLRGASFANRVQVNVNLSTGTLSSIVSVGTFTSAVANIISVGNGWYRVSLTGTTGSGEATIRGRVTSVSSGDGFSGIYIWGAQLEAGAFPTSYIPTVASAVTRSADAASMTGANFSSWYRADEGTLYGDALFRDLTGGRLIAGIYGAANVDRITIGLATTLYNGAVVAGSVIQANLSSGTKTANSKIALAYKTDDFAFSGNSATVVTDTSGILPVVDRMFIGSRFDGNAATFANGHIRKLSYYPRRLANAELQALTEV
jgi:hypothetical protein